MIHYLLDGNNILKSTPEFLKLADGNFLRAQRELVAQTAKVLCGKNSKNFATIFFDGAGIDYKFQPPPNTKVIFGKEKSADSFIIEEIKKAHNLRIRGKDSGQVVVISDDREIRECARIFGATIWRTNEFAKKLFPQHKKKTRLHPHPHQLRGYPIEKIISPAHQEKITEELKKYYQGKGRI
ncbi:hypothetical protein AUJ66_00080 [Candidatus Desantisbacteria bacterium CG1_02_38_46]|uniref:Uncharacterized protein n=3 Tax=unclassified Candidatus Desantisiibacteriota TaxID=3106372 RepID=A0A2H9PAX3_9BACT|nr:MAG: hypothetical protein AUJ66_00080 [Candidatus Desantisbacteria bacterium CG1_02_38_46]PIU51915.1 MAG: hypothetical protein COS91_02030 [Candidatus Desantisbacteria bacterium CG07_land_8_20_14_0_80_39_15]PIZ15788.1 MAG: hypothetical protein COY51_04295 [Candidatus Desantisbacteria bacterium CG_4_10_14_0_8_um_filter_39_17]